MLCQVKQSMRWVESIGLEGQRGKLGPYMANIPVNLWIVTCCSNGINRLTFLKSQTDNSGKDIVKYCTQKLASFQTVQEHKAISKPLEVPTALCLNC